MTQLYCTKCGTPMDASSRFCPNCGNPVMSEVNSPVTTPPVSQKTSSNFVQDKPCPETHLTKAILLTIFCCWPLGIPAIVNASGVSNAYIAGNYALAMEKSENAQKWCNYCIIGAVAFWILYVLFIIVLLIIESALPY